MKFTDLKSSPNGNLWFVSNFPLTTPILVQSGLEEARRWQFRWKAKKLVKVPLPVLTLMHSILFILAGICHYVPFLAAMMLIFCGKKRWVPFYPTLPICLFLMIFCVAVLPGFVLAGFTPSRYTIYGLVTLNGLCAGMGQSLLSRMIVLFPGCKGSSLIRHGESKSNT